ncbi:hypothetical protein GA0061078_0375 [Bifidobacterium bohemicum]|uniref:Uncharacterized protein n=1 Tax=Bifidobacterium bohemicum DSM 22767 TaxID=1437606 RepID=A0A086ZJC3_9BIFI|nr:hypothetical protein BBOH_0095 [Bifidobacterium bohemicum DSM 22767]SCB77048.1 hypothetical protein GA0061078_0375 [Bifidobacterium bohemicum]
MNVIIPTLQVQVCLNASKQTSYVFISRISKRQNRERPRKLYGSVLNRPDNGDDEPVMKPTETME